MLAGTAAGSSCFSTNHEVASRPPRFHACCRFPRESLTVTTVAAEAVTIERRDGYSPRRGKCNTWDALVEWYAPLIWSICCKYRLGHVDAQDVGQSVWLRLVDQLDKIRDPAALTGWLATTTRRECGRVLDTARRSRAPVHALDLENLTDEQACPADQELLAAERHAALREAFSRLPPDGQQLIAILITDPPVPYTEISARLGIPVGSVGPKRRRCLDKLLIRNSVCRQ